MLVPVADLQADQQKQAEQHINDLFSPAAPAPRSYSDLLSAGLGEQTPTASPDAGASPDMATGSDLAPPPASAPVGASSSAGPAPAPVASSPQPPDPAAVPPDVQTHIDGLFGGAAQAGLGAGGLSPSASAPQPASVPPDVQQHIASLFSGSDNTLADGSQATPGGASGSFAAPDAGQDQSSAAPAYGPVDAPFNAPARPAFSPPAVPTVTVPGLAPAPAQSFTPTTAEISGGGPATGLDDRARSIMANAAQAASWLGADGQQALQAVLVTEGGMGGALGDNGMSAGPLQFYEGGQLANFAKQNGMSLNQAKAYVVQHPDEAVRWAIGTPDAPGYLGQAILDGKQQGLSGAALATYAQKHGQVSVSPERAGSNWQALFGQGASAIGNAIGGAASQLGTDVQSGISAAGAALPTLTPPQPTPGGALDTITKNPSADGLTKLAAVPELVQNADSGYQTALQNVLPDQVKQAPVLGGALETTLDPFQAAAGEAGGSLLKAGVTAAMPLLGPALEAGAKAGKAALGVGLDYADQAAIAGVMGAEGGGLDVEGGAVNAAKGLLGKAPAATDAAEAALPAAGTDLQPAPVPGGVKMVKPATLPDGAQPITLTPAQEVDRLKLQQFPPEVRDTIAQAADTVDYAAQQRRGVIPDAVAQQMGEQYAADHTYEQVIQQGKAGAAYNTEQIRALRNATAAQAVTVNDLGAAIAKGDDSSATLAQFFVEGTKLQQLVTVAEGARAEAGRALRAYGDPAQLVNLAPDQATARIAKALSTDRAGLLKAVTEYNQLVQSGAGPVQMSQFWAKLTQPAPNVADWFRAVRYNSMISGAPTVERIAINGALESLYGGVRDAGLSALAGNKAPLTSTLQGAWLGLNKGASTFMETLGHGITEEQALQGGLPRGISARVDNPVAKTAATALEVPSRLHQAVQDVTQQTTYSMRLYQRAAEQASREGYSGKALGARIADITNAPSDAMTQDALQFSQRAASRGELGALGQKLQGVSRVPVVGNLILPFATVAGNILARGVDRTPVGALGTLVDVARTGGKYLGADASQLNDMGLTGVRPFNERAADNIAGTLAMTWMYGQAQQGNITGAGPSDAAERDQLEAQGWRPYSVKLGGSYYPYQVAGSWAIPLAMAASLAEAQTYAKPGADAGAVASDAVARTAQMFTNESYLKDIGNLVNWMTQPERYAGRVFTELPGSLIPYGALANNVAQATDPVQRQVTPTDVGQVTAERIPGLRQTLPARLDAQGLPVPNPQAGLGGFGVAPGSPVKDDPTLRALGEAGVTIPLPSKTAANRSGTVEAQLTPAEQRTLETRRGELLRQYVAGAQADPNYQKLNEAGRANALARAVSNAGRDAENEMIATIPAERRLPAHKASVTIPVKQRLPVPTP